MNFPRADTVVSNSKAKEKMPNVKNKINIMVISTSEIKISVLISKKHLIKAVAALHKEFRLSN